jgi:hypothetical protein
MCVQVCHPVWVLGGQGLVPGIKQGRNHLTVGQALV